jgi:DNA-binding CsgD family transcriptional regulator
MRAARKRHAEGKKQMLQGGFRQVMEAGDRNEFQARVVGFAQALGFNTVSAMTVIDHLLGEPEFIIVDNIPHAYKGEFSSRANYVRDPVMQHCKHKSVPIIWDQSTYTACGLGSKWETQASHGFRAGVALALHLPEGKHFFLGVDRDAPLPDDPVEVTRIVADLQLFAVHAQEAALRLLVPSSLDPDIPPLTPRELEALRWTMEGKTAWEVGNILGISERTAVLHVSNATRKLGCVSKHQAVLKALRLGMLR